MTLVRPTINLYYDKIVNGNPVPNGVKDYKLSRSAPEGIPYMSSNELKKNDQVVRTTYFYNAMKVNNVNVNLFTKKETATNLFYPLEISRAGQNLHITSVIPTKTLERIKKKKMKLLLLYQQWIGDYHLIRTLRERINAVQQYGIPSEQIYLVMGDVNCAYQELLGSIKVFGIDWSQIAAQITYKTRYLGEDLHWVSMSPTDILITDSMRDDEIISNWNSPSMLFTAFTQQPTNQAIAILSELLINDLLDKGHYDLNTTQRKKFNVDDKIFVDKNWPDELKTKKKEAIFKIINSDSTIPKIKESLEDSVLSIIIEPFVPTLDINYLSETNALWISSNVWKSIAIGHPFIVVGSLSTMRYLNNEGYFSYVDLFSETYDSVSNLAIKTNLISTEIKKLSKLTTDEIKEKIELSKPFIEANKKKFYDKKHTWKFYDLFKEMQYE
jgi:hypothetical protein